jgi:hypothetical protein
MHVKTAGSDRPHAEAMHGSGAVISPDGVYRYRLWRIWDDDLFPTAFVMLNPSTADASVDDPTIRRCMGFARLWGAGGIVVVNLFAFRTTDPKILFGPQSAERGDGNVGNENDEHIRKVLGVVDNVVCAWGAHPLAASRAREVLALFPSGVEVSCLGTTKDGHPKHPLYLRANTARVPFGGRRG